MEKSPKTAIQGLFRDGFYKIGGGNDLDTSSQGKIVTVRLYQKGKTKKSQL